MVAGILAIGLAGCSAKGTTTGAEGSAETTGGAGHSMAGSVTDIYISDEALASKPKEPVLNTPEDAVRSYLDWTSYAYRIAQSPVATPTMSPYEEVRIDSYVQYNLQRDRVLDQTLTTLTLGKPSIDGTRAIVPAQEKWTYSYVSIKPGGKVLGGPYTASYDTTYTVIRPGKARIWVVDSVTAQAQGTVK